MTAPRMSAKTVSDVLEIDRRWKSRTKACDRTIELPYGWAGPCGETRAECPFKAKHPDCPRPDYFTADRRKDKR